MPGQPHASGAARRAPHHRPASRRMHARAAGRHCPAPTVRAGADRRARACDVSCCARTSLGVQGAVVVDVRIAQAATGHSIAAHADGRHRAHLQGGWRVCVARRGAARARRGAQAAKCRQSALGRRIRTAEKTSNR